MPLDLRRPCVRHRGRKYSQNGRFSVQRALVQHGLVLGHPDREGNVVVLGPAAQGVEEEDRASVASLTQLPPGVGHEESVAVVDGVPELFGEVVVWNFSENWGGIVRST